MNYIIKLINGDKIEVSEETYKLILTSIQQNRGLIVMPDGEALAASSISHIYPKLKEGAMIDRSKQKEGVLSDGTVVIKQFGRWYCRDGVKEDDGTLATEPNPDYYPEAKLNILPTPEEYASEFKGLAVEAWLPKLIGKSTELDPRLLIDRSNRKTGGGFERIGPRDMPKIGGGDDAEPTPVLA